MTSPSVPAPIEAWQQGQAVPRALSQPWVAQAFLALAVGLFAYFVSLVVEPQQMAPNIFGLQWRDLSTDPLAFPGTLQFPHRWFGPFLAWTVGMGGEHWVHFTQLTAVLLLSLVFHVARWRGAAAIDALLIALAVALSGAVQIYKTNMIGYVDNLGYSLTLIMWLCARRSWVFWSLLCVNLVNHEMVAFFVPWFLWLRRQAEARLSHDAIGLVVAFAAYGLFRWWVATQTSMWTYDSGYFLKHTFLPISFLWLWLFAGIYQLQTFGPLLAIVVWHLLRLRPGNERVHALFVIGGFLGIFMFAYDINRHSNMVFIPLLVASVRFLGDHKSRIAYGALMVATVCVSQHYKFVPSWITGQAIFDWLNNVMIYDLQGNLLILPENRFNLALHWHLIQGMLERTWPQLFALAWEALFLVALAQWFSRRDLGGGRRVTTAGLVLPFIPPIPGAAGDACRRVSAWLSARRRTRDPRVGT